MIDVYLDEQSKIYFCEEGQTCYFCNEKIREIVFISDKYSKNKQILSAIRVFCKNCIGKNYEENLLFHYWNTIQAIPSYVIDDGWLKVVFTPPRLKNHKGDVSVYEMADKQYGDEVVVDKTVHSGREQIDYNPNLLLERDEKLRLADENLNTSPDDPMSFLKELQETSNKAIENKEKKLIGEKK